MSLALTTPDPDFPLPTLVVSEKTLSLTLPHDGGEDRKDTAHLFLTLTKYRCPASLLLITHHPSLSRLPTPHSPLPTPPFHGSDFSGPNAIGGLRCLVAASYADATLNK